MNCLVDVSTESVFAAPFYLQNLLDDKRYPSYLINDPVGFFNSLLSVSIFFVVWSGSLRLEVMGMCTQHFYWRVGEPWTVLTGSFNSCVCGWLQHLRKSVADLNAAGPTGSATVWRKQMPRIHLLLQSQVHTIQKCVWNRTSNPSSCQLHVSVTYQN